MSHHDRILAERARRLARPLTAPDEIDAGQCAVLVAGGERYGVAVTHVGRVYRDATVTPYPGVRPPWDGLVSLRGELYPVLNLPAYLGRPASPIGPHCVLLAHGTLRVAVMSDLPPVLARVPDGMLSPPPGSTAAPAGAVTGVTPDLLTVVDVAAVLSDPDLAVDQTSSNH